MSRSPSIATCGPLLLLLVLAACATTGPETTGSPATWPPGAPSLDPPDVAEHRAWQERMRSRGLGHRVHELYREAWRRRPDSAAAAYLHGRLLREPDAQSALFRRAIRLDPGLSWGHHGLAVVESRRGRPERARRAFRRAIRLAPARVEHRIGLADLERREGRLDAAEGAGRLALAADPGSARAWWLLARIAEARGDRPAALRRAREAVRRSDGARGYRAEWRRLVLALGSRAVVRHALELAEGDPEDAERDVALGLFRIRLGELRAGVEALRRACEAGADRAEIVPPWRRALVRLGRYGAAVAVDGLKSPAELRSAPGNAFGTRWGALERCAVAAEKGLPDAAELRALSRAMAAVGWLAEARAVAGRALLAAPAEGAGSLGRLLAVEDVVERLAVAVDRGYRGDDGIDDSLGALLRRADAWFRRAGLPGRPSEAERHVYPFVGEILEGRRRGASALHDVLAAHGLTLVMGRPAGGPIEVLLGEAVAAERGRRVTILGREIRHDRFVVANVRIGTRRTLEERGDLSGVALDGFYLLNLDEIALGPSGEDARAGVAPWRPVRAEDRTSVDWPGGVLARLAGAVPEPVDGARRDVVARHEEGHLLDVARYLPVLPHLPAGLVLVVESGFSPREVQGRLEGNAQLVAIAEGLSPRLALRGLVALGIDRESAPPHSLGYHDALREMVEEIASRPAEFPEVDPDANVLQQLDRLPDARIRALARTLLARRGLP